MRIYLDNSATTKIDEKVTLAMNKAFSVFGNPSSVHFFGREARNLVEQSRATVAEFLNCALEEVIFTSGGSEADNLAIRGVVEAAINQKSKIINQNSGEHSVLGLFKPHVITSAVEHHAVLHTIQKLEKEGKIEATYVKPAKNGVVQVSDIEAAIKPNTVLVSVMYVNNEVGTIQPIKPISDLLIIQNSKFKIQNYGKVLFHTDAVQAAGYLPMDVKKLGIDLLTLSGHKIHGPKGVGVLYVKAGTIVAPQITGGEHEFGKRAGTENTTAISGLAAAIAEIKNQKSKIKIMEKLRNKLEQFILKNISETYLNGDKKLRAPHITNISFKNAEGEAIILNLDHLGIAVSSGSACTSHRLEASHVLQAMGTPKELTHGAIRFSLSKDTTEAEIDRVCEVLPGIITKLRQMSPFK